MTHPRLTRSGAACIAVLLVALCCAGCGRRGKLELPPDDAAAPAATSADGAGKPAKPHKTKQIPPPRTFILDPLI